MTLNASPCRNDMQEKLLRSASNKRPESIAVSRADCESLDAA